jgi:cation:H+ antiporter
MLGLSGLFLILSLDSHRGWLDATLLTAGIIAYTIWTIRPSRRENAALKPDGAEMAAGRSLKRSCSQLRRLACQSF